jgi:hypothetical protein
MLQQFDPIDSLDKESLVTFSLENKLQAKRNGDPVDLVTLIFSSDYSFMPVDTITTTTTTTALTSTTDTSPTGFQNIRYKLELKPYDPWEFDSEAEYNTAHEFFKTITGDFWTKTGKANTVLGYRYKKGESSQLTTGVNFPLNPFWKAGIYERFEFRTGSLMEQQYILERDMHCWTMQFIISQKKSEGVGFYIAFQLKAFPEIGVSAEKTFAPPRTIQ